MNRPLTRAIFVQRLLLACFLCSLQGAGQSNSDFDRGVAEFRAGNYSSAASLFAGAESASPGSTDALLYEAKALVHLQDFPGAEKALRAYVPSHERSSDALYLLGFVLNRENKPSESLAFYTKAAALATPTADDLKIVGLDYALLNDYEDAIKWLEKAVGLDRTNRDAWYYLGRAYYTKARLGDARKAFLTVLDLDPHDAKAENNLGLIFESDGQPTAAIEAYGRAIASQERDPHPSEQPYVNLGNLLMEQGRTKEAAAPLEKAVVIAPDNAFCHLTLGVYYRKIERLQEARHELERAKLLEPDNAVVHYQLGRLYVDLHALDLAKMEFERTAEIKSRAAGSDPSSRP